MEKTLIDDMATNMMSGKIPTVALLWSQERAKGPPVGDQPCFVDRVCKSERTTRFLLIQD